MQDAILEEASETAAAIEKEVPLPFVMAEMALWGTALSMLMAPIGLVAMAASPFAVARDIWRSRTGAAPEPAAA
jgi:hypothetical protein